jgi:hypothetical protein
VSRQTSSDDPVPRESSDPLDRLLQSAPLARPDGWFTARTLARCRSSEATGRSWFPAWSGFRWAAGGILSLLLCAFTLQQLHQARETSKQNLQEAFEIVAAADTDPDVSPEDSSN